MLTPNSSRTVHRLVRRLLSEDWPNSAIEQPGDTRSDDRPVLLLRNLRLIFSAGFAGRVSKPCQTQFLPNPDTTMASRIAGKDEGSGNEAGRAVLSLAQSLNDHLDRQIDLADRKAQLILAACTFMAATIAPLTARIRLDFFSPALPPLQRVAIISTVLVVITLLVCVYYSLLVTRPALSARRKKLSLLYFGDIVDMSEQDFVQRFLNQQPEDIRNAVLDQVYQKAMIARRKFGWIRRSLTFLFLTFIFWAVVGVLLAVAP